jgi:hypothetical protein
MPISASLDIGVSSASDMMVQSLEVEKSLSEVVRKNKDGGFAMANAFDPMISGSLTILGTSGDTVGGNLSTAVSLVSGGRTIVTETTHTRTQDNFDETSVNFQNAPGGI